MLLYSCNLNLAYVIYYQLDMFLAKIYGPYQGPSPLLTESR